MSHNEWSIQTVPARHTLGTVSPSITFLSSLDLFNIAQLHRYFFAGRLSDSGIFLVLVGVLLEVIRLCISFYGQLEWDRLLWEAGPERSNRKNNHFWYIGQLHAVTFPFHFAQRTAYVTEDLLHTSPGSLRRSLERRLHYKKAQ
jgi:hypothetical protein